MNFRVKFSEQGGSFRARFGSVQTASDGGYEQGYEQGYATGYEAGYLAGMNDGIPIGTSVLGRATLGTMILGG